MDKIIWLIDGDWYTGDKASSDSVGPYIHADCLRKLVSEYRKDQEQVWTWDVADDLEQLLKRGE